MTLNEILSKNITNGRFFAIEAETEKKRKGITYRKRTTLTAQFGVNYANVASVKDRIAEQGGRSPTWFEHTEHASIVKSKKDETKLYLQSYEPLQYQNGVLPCRWNSHYEGRACRDGRDQRGREKRKARNAVLRFGKHNRYYLPRTGGGIRGKSYEKNTRNI